MKGLVIYNGPSMIDGAPIVGIITAGSKNRKTGDMAQLWILRADAEPHKAVKSGQDGAICGDCPHRHGSGGACYVLPFQGPLSVYRAWKRGAYAETFTMTDARQVLAEKPLRLGAYGDPAALPLDAVLPYIGMAKGRTGYTHQWQRPEFDRRWFQYVMASVDSEHEAALAVSMGGRYFRVSEDNEPAYRETECLADAKGLSCAECLLCDGAARGKGKNVVIKVHGQKANKFRAADIIAAA